jgi:ATP-dependent Clp protease protease subunit
MAQKIFIEGEIGYWFASEQKYQLFNLDPNEELEVYIDSPGGSVVDGTSIAALLRDRMANVTTKGIGLVGSIATMVLLAGKRVEMDKDAFLMIHNPFADYVSGDSKELRQYAAILDTMKATLADRYTEQIRKTGKLINGDYQTTRNTVLQYMANETWFTAQEALDFGLIDAIIDYQQPSQAEPVETEQPECTIVMAQMVAKCKNVPESIKNKYSIKMNKEEVKQIVEEQSEGLLNRFFSMIKGLFVAKNEAQTIETPAPEAIAQTIETAKATQETTETAQAETPATVEERQPTDEELIAILEAKGFKVQKQSDVEALTNKVKSLELQIANLSAKPIQNKQEAKTENKAKAGSIEHTLQIFKNY